MGASQVPPREEGIAHFDDINRSPDLFVSRLED
jgi:hypothetical protein